MTSKKLKLADIAELAGVSKSTVSFVLNGHAKKHRINEETVKKVEEVARANNYSPSIYARALKSKQTYTIGLVIPDLANMGFANTAKRLETLCRDNGYQLLIASSEDHPEMEKQAIQSLIDRQVDLLFVASSMTDESYFEQVKKTTPVILFDRVVESDKFYSVKTDAASATRKVVSVLAKEVTECVYIGGQLELSPSKERFSGYLAGIAEAGLEYNENFVFSKDYQPESGYELMGQVVEQLGRVPQSVFTASYSLLEGVLRYLTEKDLLTAELRLATFDNYSVLDCLPVKVDSVEQDSEQIAQALFEFAKSLISDPKSQPEQRELTAKIHFRRQAAA
ncbi:LacI family DNA-binding transcriptional regulator [Vibrio maerlii]|uniref:LacI family DNA-binding transcriptional regulator n=1 Tax=Vibrio maerlii TaxID=2231648 RepID=UPI000E3DA00B|nr:LacI family DNA-binding transcriptional regulator [Vibrio maerlii]